MRRASLYGRAPVMHDLRIAFTIWGFLDPPRRPSWSTIRRPLFEGVADSLHHYEELRALVDSVPEATLRLTPDQVRSSYPRTGAPCSAADTASESDAAHFLEPPGC